MPRPGLVLPQPEFNVAQARLGPEITKRSDFELRYRMLPEPIRWV